MRKASIPVSAISSPLMEEIGNYIIYNNETCKMAKENGETRGEKHYNKLRRHLHIAKQELGIVITSEG